ncbi:unnamed protein product [Medioppia subpectinata]|uniref:Uncharacterized protein n=1 Tax=Medioppia subpectinata TaxID=1979941 RepID=A0A7R9KY89_9ACAR|nr:unnamed protein product [Medioppia subpectinata]CAG2112050.1 unnamed protein product [Medioppia subpectinata]
MANMYENDVLEIFVGTQNRENYYRSGDDVIVMCVYSAVKNAKQLRISVHKCINQICRELYATNKNFVPINGVNRIVDESVPGMVYLTIPGAGPNTGGRYQCKMDYREPRNNHYKSIATEYENLLLKSRFN